MMRILPVRQRKHKLDRHTEAFIAPALLEELRHAAHQRHSQAQSFASELQHVCNATLFFLATKTNRVFVGHVQQGFGRFNMV